MTSSAGPGNGPNHPERERTGDTTTNLFGKLPFPDPHAELALLFCETFRAVDDDGNPVLIISDGVTTIALTCGLRGFTFSAVRQAGLVADSLADFFQSVAHAYRHSQDDPSEVSEAATRS